MLRCGSLQRHYLPVPLDHNGYYDVVIWLRRGCLARDQMPDAHVIEIPSYMGRRCLYADVTLSSGWRVRLATVHLESTGPEGPTRKAQLETIFPVLKTTPWSSSSSEQAQNASRSLPNIAVLTGDFNLCASSEENVTVACEPGVVDLWPTLEPGPGWTEDTAINEMRFAAKPQHKQVRFDRVLIIHPEALDEEQQGADSSSTIADGSLSSSSTWRGTRIALLGTTPLPSTTAVEEEQASLSIPTRTAAMGSGLADVRVWPSDHFGLVVDIALPL